MVKQFTSTFPSRENSNQFLNSPCDSADFDNDARHSNGLNKNSGQKQFWMKMRENSYKEDIARSSSCSSLTSRSLKACSPNRNEFLNSNIHNNGLGTIINSNLNAQTNSDTQFMKIVPHLFEIKESDRMDEDVKSAYLDKSSKCKAFKIDLDTKKTFQKKRIPSNSKDKAPANSNNKTNCNVNANNIQNKPIFKQC